MMSDKLRAAALAVLKSTKSLSVCCENFNHRRQDFHDDGKCPPWRRYNDALAELEDALAEPEQEPVAWYDKHGMVTHDPFEGITPLYTAPPRREWVGLTGDEIEDLNKDQTLWQIIRAAEEILKEKNCG